jgi:hypothetical protein
LFGDGALQRKVTNAWAQSIEDAGVHRAAAGVTRGPARPLPHLDTIQRAFGRHDVRTVQAHLGRQATEGTHAIGAVAFATGRHVAFAGSPDLRTAAHEAAHVVQQRGGVQLVGGVGQAGDLYEQHADAVADAVSEGRSAEALLAQCPNSVNGAFTHDVVPASAGSDGPTSSTAVQRVRLQSGRWVSDVAGGSFDTKAAKLKAVRPAAAWGR